MIRVGIDIRILGRKRTGDEVVFLNLVREMAILDETNEFFLFLDGRTEEELRILADRLGVTEKKNFRFISLPARNKFDWNAWHIPNFLRTHAIDVYHTQYIAPLFVPKRTALVLHIHDVSFREYPRFIAPLDRMFLGTLLPRSLHRADCVVAPSEFTKREIIKYYAVAEEKISVAYNAVAPEFFVEHSERRLAIRERYHLPKSFILYVGTFQPRKNIPVLIEAFAQLHEEDPDLGLVLVGNRAGHHVDAKIDATIERLRLEQSVVFPGFVDQQDLPELVSCARAFVLPSYSEGFGIPILEAMSRGVPVVASDIPALREAGASAALFASPKSAIEFAEMIRSVCHSGLIREECLSKGYERARFFSWEKSARDVLAVYEKICFHEKAHRSYSLRNFL